MDDIKPSEVPETFQARVQPWLAACFGAEIASDKIERNHRFLEEALELVQSTGCTQSEAHQLVGYVFGREVGDPRQEVGGVMVTLAALCLSQSLDMHEAGEAELARVWTKVEAIRAKQASKPKHSPLPQRVEPSQPYPTGAAWMREQAAGEAEQYAKGIVDPWAKQTIRWAANAIRNIPLPTDADLLAEAVKLPEVAAAFEACKIIYDVIMEGHDNLGDMVMHFMEAAELARTAVKDAANG